MYKITTFSKCFLHCILQVGEVDVHTFRRLRQSFKTTSTCPVLHFILPKKHLSKPETQVQITIIGDTLLLLLVVFRLVRFRTALITSSKTRPTRTVSFTLQMKSNPLFPYRICDNTMQQFKQSHTILLCLTCPPQIKKISKMVCFTTFPYSISIVQCLLTI